MRRNLWRWLLMAATLGLIGSPAIAADASSATAVAKRLAKTLPGYQVTVVDPLTIKIICPPQTGFANLQVDLDRISDHCRKAPKDCTATVDDFITKIALIAKNSGKQEPTLAALRSVVRPAAYANDLARMMKAENEEIISAPFTDDLTEMCYLDDDLSSARPLLRSELAPLNLTAQQAIEVCRKNTRAALPHLPQAHQHRSSPTEGLAGYLDDSPYELSYLLLHDDWIPLAKACGGKLLVAAPDADLILVAEDIGPKAVQFLSTTAKRAYATARRPISPKVFRWTPQGWEIAAPDGFVAAAASSPLRPAAHERIAPPGISPGPPGATSEPMPNDRRMTGPVA